ncbi:pleckstrin homology domain-containing family H member 2 [Triplophysa dalaica]|uniref:pleckstrin homology domain-containing family H member 2 n=1 Tax=Triplophysa dalaica TaxID=1582913 RepID=UPI0024DFE53A|nr:pleckstrin homology domain-containing family H member 2 [Triplophysa dalaica]
MSEGNECTGGEWKEKYMALETLLFKFRGQMSVIRELTAEKMQQLETQVVDAERRAYEANQQVQWMEERLKASDVQSGYSDLQLFKRYQSLQASLHEKDELISSLEQQLEEQKQNRIQDAKTVEEKAAKIKEWVMKKLNEFDVENASLREINQKHESEMQDLKKQLQATNPSAPGGPVQANVGEAKRLSSLTFGCFQIRGKNPQVLTGPEPSQKSISTLLDQDHTHMEGRRPSTDCGMKVPETEHCGTGSKMGSEEVGECDSIGEPSSCSLSSDLSISKGDRCLFEGLRFNRPASEANLTSDDSSSLFDDDMQRVEFSKLCLPGTKSNKKKGSKKAYIEDGCSDDLNKRFQLQCLDSSSSSSDTNTPSPVLTPALTPKRPTPSQDSQDTPASPKQPRLRTPNTFNVSLALAKKHLSQPPLYSEVTHGRTRNAISMLRPLRPHETDLDQEQRMETCDREHPDLPSQLPAEVPPKEPETPEACAAVPGSKPPTPPLHRLPSWESRIYAVAKSGIRLSEMSCKDVTNKDSPNPLSCPSYMLYTSLVYKNTSTPVFTTLKGRATLLSTNEFPEEWSSSEEEESSEECQCYSGEEEMSLSGSLTSGSESHKNSSHESPRSLKRAVSLSSMTSECDYAIPPDAYSTDTECSEPENKLPKTCSTGSDNDKSDSMEKSGYLLKMVKTWKKTWKRRWFILKDGELLYYKSPSNVIRKPQGQIELNASSTIARGDGKQILQVVTGKSVHYLKADSPNLLEEWLGVLQSVVRIKASSPLFTQPDVRPVMIGHLTKVKYGYSKHVWCALFGKALYYFRSQEDKFPLGQIKLCDARVEEVDKSCDSDKVSAQYTLSIQPVSQSLTYLLIDSPHEKTAWLYHLSVAAGTAVGQVGTEFEQLVAKLLNVDGDPGSLLWRHPTLCFTKEGLSSPLTTLPSQALQTEAIKLFKTCQLFINVAIDTPAIDYHVTLAQCALQVCLTHPELQTEIYCQLIKQTRRRQPNGQPGPVQGWQFLALCVGLFLPTHPILWLLQMHLKRHGDLRTEVGKYAIYCQRSLERTQQKGERQARSSRMEILSILLRNPYHHSLPFSVPVHFLNNTYQVVGFDASTTVEEFQSRLNQDTGVRKTGQSGFSLYSDDPTGRDFEHCLQGNLKICDIIAKWEQAAKEQHTGKSENARTIKLTYKNRLYFAQQMRGETERERFLLAYQTNEEIIAGRFPVNKELALEMAALLAQVEFGDYERPFCCLGGSGASQTKSKQTLKQVLERYYPRHYRHTCTEEHMGQLLERLSTRWASLRGRTSSECIRIYMTVARKWTLFGAKLFEAEPLSPTLQNNMRVWLTVHENGVIVLEFNTIKVLESHPHKNIVTFGACGQDFMLVVASGSGISTSKEKPTEKHLFAMASSKVRDVTLLLASYINSTQQQKSAAHHLSAPALMLAQSGERKSKESRSKSPPATCRPSKAPTLL